MSWRSGNDANKGNEDAKKCIQCNEKDIRNVLCYQYYVITTANIFEPPLHGLVRLVSFLRPTTKASRSQLHHQQDFPLSRAAPALKHRQLLLPPHCQRYQPVGCQHEANAPRAEGCEKHGELTMTKKKMMK